MPPPIFNNYQLKAKPAACKSHPATGLVLTWSSYEVTGLVHVLFLFTSQHLTRGLVRDRHSECFSSIKKSRKVHLILDSVSRSVVSDSLRPHGPQPSSLFHPWNSPGKNTGLGCHFLLPRTCIHTNKNTHWSPRKPFKISIAYINF